MSTSDLKKILSSLDDYSIDDAIYVQKSAGIFNYSVCCVLDPDETEDPDGESFDFAQQESLEYFLEVSIVIQVRDNLSARKERWTNEELFQAVIFYHKHDAFQVN